MSLVSIIVPIYNVAPYLKECLDSLVNQTYPHLEIILINDGSTDESEAIAKTYIQDSRFTLISQENGGLSKARNVGMRQASGEFIAFVDSDDYLSNGYIDEMLKTLTTHQADFVCNDNIAYFSETQQPEIQPTRKESIQVCTPSSSNIVFGGAVWRFLFATEFLKRCGVEFLEGKIYEDEAFLYMIAPQASSFVRFFGMPYFYRRRSDSIMATHANFRSYDLLDVFEAIYLCYQDRGYLKDFQPPYHFLTHASIGYKNDKEYLKRAKLLAQKHRIILTPPPRLFVKLKAFYKNKINAFRLKLHKWISA
ncbi:hypothetical protein BBW65_05045 [Helicobacter enhydrae]|uniref:Glycosyltransferase 2-like domain-containing protein n=1 Tax=Helicobacter enhydrae TaxID=222136 RepID=A0A1B1U5Z5_9HELI|nr:glycosyltransferase family A protein [Helicobacter enhydrae]ANV98203.1 hypothetical protein BBW65_05045 [Helicobacter enhydrae]